MIFEILEACRHQKGLQHLIYASSSSVYGAKGEIPFCEDQITDSPISLYGATKKANGLLAYSYSHLYGPFGRPDMAVYTFTEKNVRGEAIELFNIGNMFRYFTYVRNIVRSIELLLPLPPASQPAAQIFNIGGSNPVQLMAFVQILSDVVGREPEIIYKELQAGDVLDTYADTKALENYIHFTPKVTLEEGIPYFVDWYKNYNGIS